MTARENDLHDAWDDLADAEAEHDVEHSARAWKWIRELQQRSHEETSDDVVPGQGS